MDKQKQIEEMARDLKEEKLYALINKTSYMRSAENLYELGYRKIPENEAIQHYQAEIEALELELSQSHKIIKKLSKANGAVDWLDGYKKGFAEGVQAMQIQLKGIADQKLELYGRQMVDVDDIDSVCKELTEEKHENTKP